MSIRKPLTDSVMLAAARRRLAEHLETRPATAEEAAAIREQYINKAQDLSMAAADARCTGDIKHALELARLADRWHLQAKAWEGDMAAAWEATRVELADRVAFYASLCGE